MATATKPTMLEAALNDYGHTTESFILSKHKKVLRQNDFMNKAPQGDDRDKIEAYVATYHAYRDDGVGHDIAMLRAVNDVLGNTIPEDLSELDNEESEQPPQDPPDKRRRGNGSTPKPKPATTEAPPAEQTPQDAPPEHEPERAPMSPEVAEAAGELTHHTESPVTVHPAWNGDVLDEYNNVRYNVTIREGGTAEMVLGVINQYRKLFKMGKQYGIVCAQYDPDEGKLETGGKGTLEVDRIVWSTKTFRGETSDYLEFWRNGRDLPSSQTRKADEIAVVEKALGIQFKPGQSMTLDGGFVISYTLGNLKKDKDGNERPGTKWFDFYLNIEGVTRK